MALRIPEAVNERPRIGHEYDADSTERTTRELPPGFEESRAELYKEEAFIGSGVKELMIPFKHYSRISVPRSKGSSIC